VVSVRVSKKLYPFAEHWFELEPGVRMHYVDEGPPDGDDNRPVVLMLHGNPTWSFYWRRLIKALAPTHRVIAPDHIGCGKSDKPDDARYPYRLERRISDIERLVDHLELGAGSGRASELTLMVHDWGGMIGMGWAHRHPKMVSRLVLLNTAAFGLPSTKRMPASLWLARNTGLGTVLVRGFNAFSRGATRFCVTRRPLSAEVVEGLCAPYDSWDNRRAVLRFVQDIPLRPQDPGFEIITEVGEALGQFDDRPVLICWGERDFVFDDHFLREWERKLPHASVHRFADSGHYVLEDAGEEIEALVTEFLGVAT
jgi:haloalkane dehalogenase